MIWIEVNNLELLSMWKQCVLFRIGGCNESFAVV